MAAVIDTSAPEEAEKGWDLRRRLLQRARTTSAADLPLPLLTTDKNIYAKAIIQSVYGETFEAELAVWGSPYPTWEADWGNRDLKMTFEKTVFDMERFSGMEYRANSPALRGTAREQYARVAAGIEGGESEGEGQESRITREGAHKVKKE